MRECYNWDDNYELESRIQETEDRQQFEENTTGTKQRIVSADLFN